MKPLRRRGIARAVTAAAVFAVGALLGGCAHQTASPAASARVSSSNPASRTPPWGAVGPGWFLVIEDLTTSSVADRTSNPGAEKLWLVDPHGSRYLVLQWAASQVPEGGLRAWSPDARHALFVGNDQVADVDLVNATVTAFSVQHVVTAGYARPSGAGIVALSDDPATDPNGRGGVLRRFALDGDVQAVLASDVNTLAYPLPRWLYSRDGASVYLPDEGGLRAVSNTGGQSHRVDTIEGPTVLCSPVRWWDSHTILVSCDESGPRLWLAPDNGGTATALTAPAGIDRATSGTDWGSFDAFRTARGQIFVQRPSTCGSVDIATLDARGHAHQLTFPNSLGTDWLIGAAGDRIAVRSTTSEGDCYEHGWFGFYDPTTHTTQQVIYDPPDQLGAVAAITSDVESRTS